MSTRRRAIAAAVAATLLISGCSAQWRRVPVATSGAYPARQRLQVYHERRVEDWHSVRLGADSISGVPFFRPPTCDSCRVALPRTQVDSVRAGNPGAAVGRTVAVVAVVTALLMAWVCSHLCGYD